jgi:CBS domain-containing protein
METVANRTAPCRATGRVSELMSPDPFAAGVDWTVARARELMEDRRIRHLPVVDERGVVVGLVTERDVRSLLAAPATPLGSVMRREIQTIEPEACVASAARHMLRFKLGCLLVVDDAGRLTGILTEADFLRWAVRGTLPCACGPSTLLAAE